MRFVLGSAVPGMCRIRLAAADADSPGCGSPGIESRWLAAMPVAGSCGVPFFDFLDWISSMRRASELGGMVGLVLTRSVGSGRVAIVRGMAN